MWDEQSGEQDLEKRSEMGKGSYFISHSTHLLIKWVCELPPPHRDIGKSKEMVAHPSERLSAWDTLELLEEHQLQILFTEGPNYDNRCPKTD